MAWNLSAAKLPEDARSYLSVLGGCGDDAQAARECGVTDVDISRWSRLPDYAEHHALALEHYRSWKDWGERQLPDPSLPPRPGSPDPHGAFAEDGRRGIGRRLADWGRVLFTAEPDKVEAPSAQRFIPLDEMSDMQLLEARVHMAQRERLAAPQGRDGLFRASGDPGSMPEPEPDTREGSRWQPHPYGAPPSESFPWPGQ